jgi:hypothetical protein
MEPTLVQVCAIICKHFIMPVNYCGCNVWVAVILVVFKILVSQLLSIEETSDAIQEKKVMQFK